MYWNERKVKKRAEFVFLAGRAGGLQLRRPSRRKWSRNLTSWYRIHPDTISSFTNDDI